MSLATLKEDELFSLLTNSILPDLERTEQLSRWDGYSKKYSMAVEIKCRRKVYDEVLIEKDKYMYLQSFENARYIISDPIGIFSFDVKLIEPGGWYPHYMPATTEFINTDKIIKIVGYIPKKYSINITNQVLK